MRQMCVDTAMPGLNEFITRNKRIKKKQKLGRGISMEMFHTAYLAFLPCSRGLIENELWKHASDVWSIYVMATNPKGVAKDEVWMIVHFVC